MKETTKMSRTVGQLEKMYNILNLDFFDGSLPLPIITVQSKPRSYGHCSLTKIWQRKDDETYELNIAAEVLMMPIEETIDTLLHEMIHLYCRQNDIKEVSRGGAYHNTKFKEEAEKRGLKCIYNAQYGWNTTPSDNLIEYALEKGWSEMRIARKMAFNLPPIMMGGNKEPKEGKEGKERKASSTRKYQCQKCGNSVRATKDLYLICGDCMYQMMKV